MSSQLLSKPSKRWLIGLIIAATAVTGATVFYGASRFGMIGDRKPSQPIEKTPIIKKVTALGRLEPMGEVIRLSAPVSLDGDRVAQVLVKQGDQVQQGQVIAILDSRDRLQSALEQAKQQVRVAQSRLAQVKSGAKTGKITAQKAEITRLQAELEGEFSTQSAAIARYQAELNNARAEYNRFQMLYREGAESASNLDNKRLTLETAQAQVNQATATQKRTAETLQEQLKQAKATLNQITEVRPVDVQAAQTEVDQAVTEVKRAQTELNLAYIHAPIVGQILKIHTHPGEKISESGIAELGQTSQMAVVAEVYQTDIGKVKLGQKAVITSQAFPGELQGTVSEIGLQVSRQNVFSNQPGENLDRRVVEVKINLNPEHSQRVAGLTNLQVQVAIQE
ncbi:ABC exporter membrane fusion protein [Allocoleopsis franciscana]|uniref:ABC exporter membrane fusion protein, DevB family n=1 Tax=Allocoleopsis franciscana PCC 7113 TaxID=1173027 RepID=K9WLM2_9CYAN|nr:ABC exporter membrane fusion protein [Allocoleopsis franciscana]AFZ21058.1 ABC exporter membrane fusion protein, DevB family [Allocoleopsis franciscana PCC 7113]